MLRQTPRYDTAIRAALVVGLWSALYFLGATLSQTVILATLAAIFGPDAVLSGIDHLARGRASPQESDLKQRKGAGS